jgi:hypothetical protein
MGDALLRKRLGREAQAFAATWSAPEQASRLLELYRDVAGGSAVGMSTRRAGSR